MNDFAVVTVGAHLSCVKPKDS